MAPLVKIVSGNTKMTCETHETQGQGPCFKAGGVIQFSSEVKTVARKSRAKSNSGIYHIIIRGINRQSIFGDDEDRLKFIEDMARCKENSQCRIFAYCLMGNHIHLLLQENQESISVVIQRLSSSYVSWYNRKYDRCGHLFQERFKSEAVETDSYFLTVLRYIHQNPVKAKIASDIAAYPWSSYNEYLEPTQLVDQGYGLCMFSDKPDKAVERFEQFSREANNDVCLEIPETKVNVSDDQLCRIISDQFGVETIKFCDETKEKQDQILRALKKIEGANIRQIARITGLSPTRVWRA